MTRSGGLRSADVRHDRAGESYLRTIRVLGLVGLLLTSAGVARAQEEPAPAPTDAAASVEPSTSQSMPTEAELLQDLMQGQADAAAEDAGAAGDEKTLKTAPEGEKSETETEAEATTMAATASAGSAQLSAYEVRSKNEVDQFVGSFNQTYTIDVPQFRGLEPALALSYDSGRGNSYLGVGWKLDGISVIDRASVRRGSPAYDATDVFMLDGEEMVACTASMASPSCTIGGTHTTRVESYLRIAFDSPTNKWAVWSRTGTKLTYAPVATWFAPGTNITNPHQAYDFRWMLQTVEDTHGNQVAYTYDCSGASCYANTISYNGTVIKLWWEVRPDDIAYLATGDGYQAISSRLKSIDIQTGGQRVRAYALTYAVGTATARSRLVSVRQYGRNAVISAAGAITSGTALPPLSLSYSEGTNAFQLQAWSTQPGSGYSITDMRTFLPGDFNGDGRTDIAYAGPGDCTARSLLLSNGTSFTLTTWTIANCTTLTATATEWRAEDVNGDGKTDLIAQPSHKQATILYSTGSGFTYADWAPAATVGQDKWLAGDYDGDGKTDFAEPALGAGCTVRMLMAGAATPRQSWNVATGTCPTTSSSLAFDSAGVQGFISGDFNGDGKSDLARGYFNDGFYLQVFLSTGSGFKYQLWNAGTWNRFTNECWKFGDFNGDGKTDLMRFYQSPSYTYSFVYISSGNGIGEVNWTNGLNYTVLPESDSWEVGDINGDGRDDVVNTTATQARAFVSTGTAFTSTVWATYSSFSLGGTFAGDYDGNGKADIALFKLTSGTYWPTNALVSQGANPDLITGVTNELGGSTAITYTPSSAWSNTNLPFVLQTVSQTVTNDGRGNSATTNYSYAGGAWNAAERRFLGFQTATATLPCITGESTCPKVTTTFQQSLAGYALPTSVQRLDGAATLLAETIEQYTLNTATLPYSALNTATTSTIWVGGSPKSTEVTRAFDAYGNLTRLTSRGNTALSGDEVTSYSDFVAPNTTAYIVGLPTGTRTYAGVDDTTGVLKAASYFYYDGAVAYTTQPVDGDLTKQADWLDTASGYVNTTAEYDSYGNRTAAVDPLGNRIEWIYDSTYHLFAIETRDPLYIGGDTRHKTTATWDVVCQRPDIAYDLNVQATDYTYDPLCRETRVDTPGGGFVITSYNNIGTPTTQYVETQTPAADASGNLWNRAYLDGFGRSYRSLAKGPASGQEIEVATAFTARGQVASQTAPRYLTGTAYTTTFSYDALDRPTRQTHPDSNYVQTAYGFSAATGGFDTVTATDELGRPTTVHMDAYGRTIRKDRLLSSVTVSTHYQYDALGRLTGVTDNAGNQWTYTYDSLGRRISANDPDLGYWTYVYDDAGRLIDQTDALGQVTHLAYDGLGRVLTKTARYGTVQAAATTYTYDQARGGYYNVGQLTTMANAAATIEQDYDVAQRLSQKRYVVDSTTYAFSTGYDTGNRVIWQSYPGGDMVGSVGTPITYDGAGRLKAVPGLVADTTYDARGQVLTLARANGANTSYTYSLTRGWLIDVDTVTAGVDQTPDAFSFPTISLVEPYATVDTRAPHVTQPLAGFDGALTAQIVTSGPYFLSKDNGATWAKSTLVVAGDTLVLRAVAPAASTQTTVQVQVGAAAGQWVFTTRAPISISFAAITGAARSTAYTSTTATINGFTGTLPLTLSRDSNGSAYQYRLNGGAWVSLASAPATIQIAPGTTLQLGLTASASYSTAASITGSIDGQTATWTVTTGAAPPTTCPAQSVTWSGSVSPCSGTLPVTNIGQSRTVYYSSPARAGEATYQCTTGGVWVKTFSECTPN